MERYLITGGNGFIGAFVARLLLKDGNEVVTFNVDPDRSHLLRVLDPEDYKRLVFVLGDVSDLSHLIRTCQQHRIDKIIHMAGLLSIDASANPIAAVKVNIEGTVNVFDAARILNLKRVVYASTLGVFGTPEKRGNEYIKNDSPQAPANIYAAAKTFNEVCAAHYTDQWGLDTIGLRYTFVYGEGQTRGFTGALTQELFENPVLGKPGKLPYTEENVSWMYVEDAARATFLASQAAKTKTRAFNVDGYLCSIREVIAIVQKFIPGADVTLLNTPAPLVNNYDCTPAREELGYVPQWTVEQGIERLIGYLKKVHNK
jgi:UDP-glucose 4-epimerase